MGQDLFHQSNISPEDEMRYVQFEPQFKYLNLPQIDFDTIAKMLIEQYKDSKVKLTCSNHLQAGCYFENTPCSENEKKKTVLKLRVGDGYDPIIDKQYQLSFLLEDDMFTAAPFTITATSEGNCYFPVFSIP